MKENFDALVQHLLNGNIFLEQAIEVLERSMIEGALKRSNGNHSAASKLSPATSSSARRARTRCRLDALPLCSSCQR